MTSAGPPFCRSGDRRPLRGSFSKQRLLGTLRIWDMGGFMNSRAPILQTRVTEHVIVLVIRTPAKNLQCLETGKFSVMPCKSIWVHLPASKLTLKVSLPSPNPILSLPETLTSQGQSLKQAFKLGTPRTIDPNSKAPRPLPLDPETWIPCSPPPYPVLHSNSRVQALGEVLKNLRDP